MKNNLYYRSVKIKRQCHGTTFAFKAVVNNKTLLAYDMDALAKKIDKVLDGEP